jgi:hypothetical protein
VVGKSIVRCSHAASIIADLLAFSTVRAKAGLTPCGCPQRLRLKVLAHFDAGLSPWATPSEPLTIGADFPAVAFRHGVTLFKVHAIVRFPSPSKSKLDGSSEAV